jgi:pyruvate-formate lyase-activating enzyme
MRDGDAGLGLGDARGAERRGAFQDWNVTAAGEPRASVAVTGLKTVWFNTGSLCNIACANCYVESSPRNDRLAYLSLDDVRGYLDEVARHGWPVEEIGFTGGEPFLNRALPEMLGHALGRGFRATVLTNAMKPMQNQRRALERIDGLYGPALTMRVSIDHFTKERHERVRGEGTWAPMIDGLRWMSGRRFRLTVAARMLWGERDDDVRQGYAALFAAERIPVDAHDRKALVLFPEMDAHAPVPEITTRCWDLLGRSPDDMMCATSRMIIRRKDAAGPVVVPCTLLPDDPRFEMGARLADALRPVKLNHPYCAQFCVLGGASCSAA